jgi:hypothetical protein
VTPIKSMKDKYELLFNGRKMSESVEILKWTMLYIIGTCPHLFLLKAHKLETILECFHYLWTFSE